MRALRVAVCLEKAYLEKVYLEKIWVKRLKSRIRTMAKIGPSRI